MLQHLLCNILVYSIGTVVTAPKVFFFFRFSNRFVFFFFFHLNIYVSWYIYFYSDTTNFKIFTIIDVSIPYQLK